MERYFNITVRADSFNIETEFIEATVYSPKMVRELVEEWLSLQSEH
jgi:hypothetical protein